MGRSVGHHRNELSQRCSDLAFTTHRSYLRAGVVFHLRRIRCERLGGNEPLPGSFLPHFATPDEANTMAAYVAGPLSFATNGALRVEGSVVRSNF